ncbi:hypothetical protein [Pseudomonas brassicacearum]|uniref:hypothetical protein n=1 Tax=Pseudomonas brassicacearum TaxID=930166 RepID=UPI001866AC26|nr:hypothetical protein [Pseudomonas brassicacearum]QGA49680.2 hypothetical protein GFU70_11280 [Pseudomonas brassicacearum]
MAATKGISVVPGLAKQYSIPLATAAFTISCAPFISSPLDRAFAVAEIYHTEKPSAQVFFTHKSSYFEIYAKLQREYSLQYVCFSQALAYRGNAPFAERAGFPSLAQLPIVLIQTTTYAPFPPLGAK